MRCCSIRGVELRLHPLLIAVFAGAMVLGRLDELLVAFLALTIHETSHALAAALFGNRILSIELMPFGSVARLRESALPPYAELVIAAAGPLASLIAAGAASCSLRVLPMPQQVVDTFFSFNLTLALVNLLPVLPLDGGRILRAFLSGRMTPQRSTRLLSCGGIAAGAVMLLLTVLLVKNGKWSLTLPVMGAFLILAAVAEVRNAPEMRLRAYITRANGMQNGQNLPVHHIAASESMPASEALRLMRANSYNLLRVVDRGMHFVGEIDEGDLLLGMARMGRAVSVGEILLFDRRK